MYWCKMSVLRRLRDEAHRFAIAFHRQQRLKASRSSQYINENCKELFEIERCFMQLENEKHGKNYINIIIYFCFIQ